jgi:hypothetical protein
MYVLKVLDVSDVFKRALQELFKRSILKWFPWFESEVHCSMEIRKGSQNTLVCSVGGGGGMSGSIICSYTWFLHLFGNILS